MVELVDAGDSKSPVLRDLPVRVRPRALLQDNDLRDSHDWPLTTCTGEIPPTFPFVPQASTRSLKDSNNNRHSGPLHIAHDAGMTRGVYHRLAESSLPPTGEVRMQTPREPLRRSGSQRSLIEHRETTGRTVRRGGCMPPGSGGRCPVAPGGTAPGLRPSPARTLSATADGAPDTDWPAQTSFGRAPDSW